jgi:hypothetical protein
MNQKDKSAQLMHQKYGKKKKKKKGVNKTILVVSLISSTRKLLKELQKLS